MNEFHTNIKFPNTNSTLFISHGFSERERLLLTVLNYITLVTNTEILAHYDEFTVSNLSL